MFRLSVLLVLLLTGLLPGCACLGRDGAGPVLHQQSSLQALLAGDYAGSASVAELKRRGDLGIGTFDGLDGEMAMVDGQVWRIASDGRAALMDDAASSPYASVIRFRPLVRKEVRDLPDLAALQRELDALAPAQAAFQAVRVRGRFAQVRTRSVPRQTPPYPPLTEVVKSQPVFDLRDVEGDLVGFRFPEAAKAYGVAGWHLHFISADRTVGGHVLDCRVGRAEAGVAPARRFVLELPAKVLEERAAAPAASEEDVRRVER